MWRYVCTRYLPTYLLGTYLTTFKILGPDLMFAFGFCNFVAALVLFFSHSLFCNFVCCNSFLQSLCLLSCVRACVRVCSFCFFSLPSATYLFTAILLLLLLLQILSFRVLLLLSSPADLLQSFCFCCCCNSLIAFFSSSSSSSSSRFYSGGKSSLT